jgi:hypothetical protein
VRLPGPVAIHVVVLSVLLFCAFFLKGPWDPDYYWHVKTGELIAGGGYPRTDPFSFTWAGQPWTLHEWLSQLVLFRLVDGFGYMGALVVFALLPPAAVGILAVAFHRLGLRTLAILGATALAALLVIPYASIRPQEVSWVFFAALMGMLLHLDPRRSRWVLVLAPMFALWANLHGLWVVGLVVLLVYVVLTILGATPMSRARGWALAMLPLACLGVVFTPEGPELLTYPLRYVDAGDWGAANITEWQSPDFHEPAHWPLLGFMAAAAIFARWRVPWWLSIICFLGIAMTLLSLRNGAVAAIIGAPAIAIGMDSALRDWRPNPRSHSPRVAQQRRILEILMAAIVAVAGVIIFMPRDPAAAVEESIERELPVQGVQHLSRATPDARVLAWYGWGGYVGGTMYDLGGRVFVDGRNDMYDDSILEAYDQVRTAEPGWNEIADRYEVDALLFPPSEAITKGPAEIAGWCEAYRDANEVLFLRTCD